jgi:rare lipoprotein A
MISSLTRQCLAAALAACALCATPAWAQEDAGLLDDAERVSAVSEAPVSRPAQALRELQRGIASWYGHRFHGRKTASGEVYDMNALTAAHPSLPFGTIVRVQSLVNGRSVDVRINDRGPHIRQRVIDLSRAAAKALGLIDAGTGTKPVVLTVLPAAGAGEE